MYNDVAYFSKQFTLVELRHTQWYDKVIAESSYHKA